MNNVNVYVSIFTGKQLTFLSYLIFPSSPPHQVRRPKIYTTYYILGICGCQEVKWS